MSVKKWFSVLSFGDTAKYVKLLLWFMVDSIVATIPYGVVILAIYFLLGPIAHPGEALDTDSLWKLVVVLAIQALAYLIVRMKSYVMSCCGMAEGMKKARLDIGEHLRKLPLGFFSQRDAGELSTVLLRDLCAWRRTSLRDESSLIRPGSGKDIAKTKGVLFTAMIVINERGI